MAKGKRRIRKLTGELHKKSMIPYASQPAGKHPSKMDELLRKFSAASQENIQSGAIPSPQPVNPKDMFKGYQMFSKKKQRRKK